MALDFMLDVRAKGGGRLIVLACVDDICITGDPDADIEARADQVAL
jgi:hypothetical protein